MTEVAQRRAQWEDMKSRFSNVALRVSTAGELIEFMETAPELRGEIWDFSSELGCFEKRDASKLVELMETAPEIRKRIWDFLCDRRFLGTEDLRRVETRIPDSEIVEKARTLLRQRMRALEEEEAAKRVSRPRV